jgi:hypothetical protein
MTQRTIPHSQLTEKAPLEIFEKLRQKLFNAFPVDVEKRESCISVEKAEALWMREGHNNGPACSYMKVPGSREFAHLHPGMCLRCFFRKSPLNYAGQVITVVSVFGFMVVTDHDTSMHCNLPPNVEEEVLKQGWGERHPKYVRFEAHPDRLFICSHKSSPYRYDMGVKETLIFGPRNDEEIDIVMRIVKESYWYAKGVEKV